MQASDGNLYGTTALGGKNGFGRLFRATLAGEVVTLHSFAQASGYNQFSALLQHTNGASYMGDTTGGGTFDLGVFFSFDAGLPPFVTYLPTYGRPGVLVQILGQGFTDSRRFASTGHLQRTKLSIHISEPLFQTEPPLGRSPSPPPLAH